MSGSDRSLDATALLNQVAEAREKLREERAAIKPRLAELHRLTEETNHTRKRVRKAAARFLKRMRAKAQTDLMPVVQARQELALQQEELNRAFAELSQQRTRFEQETSDQRVQVKQSWDLLAQQQRQFTADRETHENNQSQLFQLLERREKDLEERERRLKADRAGAQQELSVTRAELTGLEQRVLNARFMLNELEQKRQMQQVTSVPSSVPEIVSLALPADQSGGKSNALHQHAHELHLERRALDRSRQELEKLAEHLTDQRQVLAEQFQQFTAAKQSWQHEESHTIDEIEQLARDVERREEMLAIRRRECENREVQSRERDRDVWRYRQTLDHWHSALIERETQFVIERESAETGLSARRGVVADREAGLDFLCQKWEHSHQRIQDQLQTEIAKWTEDRKQCTAAIQSCELVKRQTQEQAAKLASWLLAVEQQQLESSTKPESRVAARRVKALQKRWESRFSRTLRQAEGTLAKLHAESRTLETRYRDYQQLLVKVSEREYQLAISERKRDSREALTVKLPPEPPILLRVADARRQRSDEELALLRRSAQTLSDVLQGKDADDEIVPLKAFPEAA